MADLHQILSITTPVAALMLLAATTIRLGAYIDRVRRLSPSDDAIGASNVHDRYSFARLGK